MGPRSSLHAASGFPRNGWRGMHHAVDSAVPLVARGRCLWPVKEDHALRPYQTGHGTAPEPPSHRPGCPLHPLSMTLYTPIPPPNKTVFRRTFFQLQNPVSCGPGRSPASRRGPRPRPLGSAHGAPGGARAPGRWARSRRAVPRWHDTPRGSPERVDPGDILEPTGVVGTQFGELSTPKTSVLRSPI